MSDLPKPYQSFSENYPEVVEAYEKLGETVHQAGPLDEKMRSLIKLAIAAGAQKEGGVHSHTRKALDAGASKEEIRQCIVLMLPTLGMPSMMAALTWVEDILGG